MTFKDWFIGICLIILLITFVVKFYLELTKYDRKRGGLILDVIEFLEGKLKWIVLILGVVAFISIVDNQFSQMSYHYDAALDELEAKIEKRIQDRDLAITEHFKTSEWVLQDSVSTGESRTYLLSTKEGNYIITLNAERNKVIKSIRQGGKD